MINTLRDLSYPCKQNTKLKLFKIKHSIDIMCKNLYCPRSLSCDAKHNTTDTCT